MTLSKRIVECSFGVAVILLATFMFSQSPSGPVFLNIDHVSVCGSNLETMQQAFASAGLTTDYGGPHATGGTHMSLLGFADGSYIELIAPQAGVQGDGNGWGKLMADNAGPCAWAVEPKDIAGEVARLKSVGMSVEGPTLGSRKKPDGMAIEWDTAKVGAGAPGSTLPFLIQDRTPREWRVTVSKSVDGSGLSGVEVAVIAVNDLNAAISLFRKAYGWSAPLIEDHNDFEGKLAYFPGEPVILAAPAGGHSWLGDRLQKYGETPAAYLLATQDLNAVMKKFHLSGNKTWFGQRVAWFDSKKLNGVRLGVIGQ
jgi:Glyoxalase-like domain